MLSAYFAKSKKFIGVFAACLSVWYMMCGFSSNDKPSNQKVTIGQKEYHYVTIGDASEENTSKDAFQVKYRKPIAVDGGEKHSVILYNDGTVATIGNDTYGQRSTSGWRNIIRISTFANHTLGLRSDGTVVASGANYQDQCEVSDWKDIICVAAGAQHSVGLKRDGTVVTCGANGSGQCDVDEWEGIVYVAANGTSTFGLTEDGRIKVAGSFQNRNLNNWQDIVSFSVSANHVVGVHSDGTISAVGANDRGQRDSLEGKRDVTQAAVGYGYTAGLKNNGKVWVNGCDEHNEHAAMQWTNIVTIGTGTEHLLGIKQDGTLVAKGTNDDGQCDVYALNQRLEKEPVDLLQYMDMNIHDFKNVIADMKKVPVTDGIEYSNEKVIVGAGNYEAPEAISFISIDDTAEYSLMGITVGMSFSEAMEIADSQCIESDVTYPTCKRYKLKDDFSVTIWSEDSDTVSSVAMWHE